MAFANRRKKPQIRGVDIEPIRMALGLSQVEFAKRIGVESPVTVSRWENGHGNPAPYLYAKIRAVAREAGVEL